MSSRLLDHRARSVDEVSFDERIPHRLAFCHQEGIRHAPAQQNNIDPVQQILDYADLVRHLRASKNGNKRPPGVVSQRAKRLDFGHHQISRVGWKECGNSRCRSMRTMRGAKRVVDEEVAQGRKSLREFRVILFFTRFEADILEKKHLTGFQRCSFGLSIVTDHIARQLNWRFEQFRKAIGNGLQRVFRIDFSLGPAQVRHQHK